MHIFIGKWVVFVLLISFLSEIALDDDLTLIVVDYQHV